ncbi:MAG: transketolase, partial [Trueperaceae bacterium]
KWRGFGWAVTEVDGHDHAKLLKTFNSAPHQKDKPTCIITHTHKGKGVSFMEDNAAWHHKVPNAEEYAQAMKELESVLA